MIYEEGYCGHFSNPTVSQYTWRQGRAEPYRRRCNRNHRCQIRSRHLRLRQRY